MIHYLLGGDADDEKKLKEQEKQEKKDKKSSTSGQPSEYATSSFRCLWYLNINIFGHYFIADRLMLSLAEERVEYFFQYLNSEVITVYPRV